MRIRLAALALLAALVAEGLAAPSTAPARPFKPVKLDWGDGDKVHAFHYGDLTVSLSAQKGMYGKSPAIAVNTPRQGKATLTGQESALGGASATFYVLRLDPKSDGPAVIFTSFSWGAHCCTEIDVLDPIGTGWVTVNTGMWDGDGLTETPHDVDGDGIVDIVLRDNSFLYTFDAYAFSWAPPLVLNLVGGKLSDVSASSRYRRLFADDMTGAREQCLKHVNGGCAGYVADAARIGQVDAAWKIMRTAYQRQVDPMFQPTVCAAAMTGKTCPTGKEQKIKSFPEALAWFLANQGYITAEKAHALAAAR